MLYDKRKKFAFIHIPKTAGTSILTAFKYKKRNILTKHAPMEQFVETLGLKNVEKLFTFTFVRNPWERLHSLYYYLLQYKTFQMRNGPTTVEYYKEIGFNKWLLEESWRHCWTSWKEVPQQIDWLKYNDEIKISFIGRYENLKEDFALICEKLKIKNIKLPHVFKTERAHYTEEYSQESTDKIADIFAEDIEFFKYDF